MRSAGRLTERFAALRVRNLRYVFGSTFVSGLGDGIVNVALAFAVLDRTHSATDLGIVMAAKLIASIAVTFVGGVVADRVSRRLVMTVADLVQPPPRCSGASSGMLSFKPRHPLRACSRTRRRCSRASRWGCTSRSTSSMRSNSSPASA